MGRTLQQRRNGRGGGGEGVILSHMYMKLDVNILDEVTGQRVLQDVKQGSILYVLHSGWW